MSTSSASRTSALLPCPFCGEPPTRADRTDNYTPTKHVWFIFCYCGGLSANAHQFGATEAEVIEKWNRRSTPSESGESKARAVPAEFRDLLAWAEAAYLKLPNSKRFNRPVLERAREIVRQSDCAIQEQFQKNLAESEADLREKLKPYEDGEQASRSASRSERRD